MEIKKVENNIANYPKKNEIEKSEIKKATPKKWIFPGMLMSVVDMIGGKVWASSVSSYPVIAGGVQVSPIVTVGVYIGITEVIGFALLIVAIVDILYTKIRAKIKKVYYKISKKQKIFTIVSMVLIVLCEIVGEILNYYYLYD